MIDLSGYECPGGEWILHSATHDAACGCIEEQWLTSKGCLNLHVAKDESVLECWIGYSFDEDDTQAIITSPTPSRLAAYEALLGEMQEDWS